uniref:Trace amine-associated receptor n=1 Tax=Coilia nasus TaxID=365059 RepID=A0A3S6CKD0_COINA|nr:trace amine-associated receptor [Coilia nasus]
MADLHVGLLVMPVEGMRLIETCWYFGDAFCYVFPVIMFVVVSASLGNLVFISVDRYIAVNNPLKYYSCVTPNKAMLCISLSWFGSFVYAMLMLSDHLQSKPQRACHGECLIVFSVPRVISDVVFSFLAPCSIVICLYVKIFFMAKYQTRVMNSVKNANMTTEHVKFRKSESKAAKTLGIVVAIYLLCWIPYYICTLAYGSASSTSVVLTFLIWFMYINSCMNPLIYALFYPWFRVSAKHILTLAILDPGSQYYSLNPDDV